MTYMKQSYSNKDKLSNSVSQEKTPSEMDTFPRKENYSQDADRHRKIKHPISEK